MFRFDAACPVSQAKSALQAKQAKELQKLGKSGPDKVSAGESMQIARGKREIEKERERERERDAYHSFGQVAATKQEHQKALAELQASHDRELQDCDKKAMNEVGWNKKYLTTIRLPMIQYLHVYVVAIATREAEVSNDCDTQGSEECY